MTSPPTFHLPGKVEGLLATLCAYYGREKKALLQRILANASYRIEEDYERSSNFNEEASGHLIRFQIPQGLFLDVMDNLTAIEKEIHFDLNRISRCPNEFFCGVNVEQVETADILRWREESGALLMLKKSEKEMSDAAERLWTKGYLRAFLSHKAEHKKQAAELKIFLTGLGISAFVAHEDIEPTKEWQDEIELALSTQDVCVALLTEEFSNSKWTDQEIGIAIGRGVPIVSVRLGQDPYGFIGKFQAVTGAGKKSEEIAGELVQTFLGNERLYHRMTSALILSLEKTRSYVTANRLMEIIKTLPSLSPDLIKRLENAPEQNSNVKRAYKVQNALLSVISRLKNKTEDGKE